jgi:protein-S-isoprenylcysteine O-methyltransferase Ste14
MAWSTEPNSYKRVVRRLRVPLGFLVAIVFLVWAHPTLRSLLWSLLPVLCGVWLRGYAAGYVKKNAELTVTGPYAHTRNPLYLGSMLIAFGIALASGRVWLAVLLVVLFLLVYLPVISSEEIYLRSVFPTFAAYAAEVPRLLPRLTPARLGGVRGRFSRELYLHHREYNACIGVAAMYAALVLRMLLHRG